jgi:Cyclic nucleotide-binding domain
LGKEAVEDELVDFMKESTLFSALNPDQLRSVAREAKLHDYERNQSIVREGDPAASFCLILDGLVEVRRADRPITRLGRGQFFGESALVGGLAKSPGVRAVRKTRCMTLSGSILRSYPTVVLKILEESSLRDQGAAPLPAVAATFEGPSPSAVEGAIEFRSERTRLVFDCLVKSFTGDYMVRRLYSEQAGWRTLGELSKTTKIPRATLYGEQGLSSAPLNELLSRGLIETRTFSGQRGRGGEVLRARISYDKEPVKRYVDRFILRRNPD